MDNLSDLMVSIVRSTYPLAALAKSNNTEVISIGNSYKYNFRSHYGHEVLKEKKLSSEVFDIEKGTNINILNYYFARIYRTSKKSAPHQVV